MGVCVKVPVIPGGGEGGTGQCQEGRVVSFIWKKEGWGGEEAKDGMLKDKQDFLTLIQGRNLGSKPRSLSLGSKKRSGHLWGFTGGG